MFPTVTFEQLNTADVDPREMNPLAYDLDSYPGIINMINSPQFNDDCVHPIDLKALGKNGLLVQDDMKTYLKKKAISSSALKEILKTPFHYKFYNELKHEDDDGKPHFELGTFAHMAFIEPERFDKVLIEPEANLSTRADVIKLIRFYEGKNKAKERLTGEEDVKLPDLKTYLADLKSKCPYSMVPREYQDIIDVLRFGYDTYGNGIIKKILKGARGETSFYSRDKQTGLPVKIRADYFNIEENIGVNAIISFKTTAATTLNKFLYDTAKFQYELSEGMYQIVASEVTGREFNVTIMIMLQTVPPYLPAVFWWRPEDLQNGKYKYRFAMDLAAECERKRLFPGFDASSESGDQGIIQLFQPDWNKRELQPIDIEE